MKIKLPALNAFILTYLSVGKKTGLDKVINHISIPDEAEDNELLGMVYLNFFYFIIFFLYFFIV